MNKWMTIVLNSLFLIKLFRKDCIMRAKEQITNDEKKKAANRRKSNNQYYEPLAIRSQILGAGQTGEAGKTEGQNRESEY